jgi:hypothetical protein
VQNYVPVGWSKKGTADVEPHTTTPLPHLFSWHISPLKYFIALENRLGRGGT